MRHTIRCVACRRAIPGPRPRHGGRRWFTRHQVDFTRDFTWMHPACAARLVALAVAYLQRPCRECGELTDTSDRLCLDCWMGVEAA